MTRNRRPHAPRLVRLLLGLRRCALFLLLLAGWLVARPTDAAPSPSGPETSPAEQDPAQQASAHFRRGVDLYRDGDFRAALIEFKRAYEIAPNYQVLYNLGQASAELQDYVAALVSFEQYLSEGGPKIAPERRAAVEAEIEKLRPRVARLQVEVDPEGAEVLVDDVVRGHSPLVEPLLVSGGRRKVGATKAGYVPTQRYVDIAGRDEQTVKLVLAPVAPGGGAAAGASATPTPSPAVPLERAEEESNTGLWVSLAITLGLGAATGVVGAVALSANGSYQDELDTYPTSKASIDDARDKVSTLALTTDILAAATGGAAIVTVLFAVLGSTDDATEPEGTNDQPITARIAPTVGGVAVAGEF